MASRSSSMSRGEKQGRGNAAQSSAPRRRPSPSPSPARRNVARPPPPSNDDDEGRVRVAVRVRPKNAEELSSEADFADCIELQPELKRLILKKNNWSSESYKFDEVFVEAASQKRVYDAVAKPVAESVLNGYNGTVMAYGQTGSGKTYTLGRLGKHDPSERGIMVRALEDILSSISPSADAVAISYLQLYMESIQDLLAPEKSNIQIVEDSKTAEVSLPGSTVIKVRDIHHALQLLEIGESNRHTANTKYNTESSRSHAILLVYVQRSVKGKGESESSINIKKVDDGDVPIVVRSKLLMVDLAGSERIDKSGGDGHMIEEAKFINLSLTSLGKCINAIAENSPHIPIRDSKLTRLLRDSFGGSARTSLVITIGPSGRHIGETTSTIMFGQRAMKIENVMKLREECDYEALCRKLELQLDFLTAENEREKRLRDVEMKEMQNKLKEYEQSLGERGKSLALISESSAREKRTLEEELGHILSELSVQKERHGMMCKEVESLQLSLRNMRVELQVELQNLANEMSPMYNHKHNCYELHNEFVNERHLELGTMKREVHEEEQLELLRLEITACHETFADARNMYETKISDLLRQLEDENTKYKILEKEFIFMKHLTDQESSRKIQEQTELDETRKSLKELRMLYERTLRDIQLLKLENEGSLVSQANLSEQKEMLQKKLSASVLEREHLQEELAKLKNSMLIGSSNCEVTRSHGKENTDQFAWGIENHSGKFRSYQSRDTISIQRATITKIFEEVGLQKIVALLRSEDLDVQIHAAKVVANLASEDANQEKIVNEGGLDVLLLLLDSQNETIRRVASGAIANLAMNENNQALIMCKGGARLLSNMASKTDDSQTQRMVAGAIANLCGNEKLHAKLKEDGGIKALLEMARSGHKDVIAQVARGFANFAKCESRGAQHQSGVMLNLHFAIWLNMKKMQNL
ncbi:kinesin-like protein KIN-UC isoform X2 [Nymphaea colorata]|uniref:kinesin-like protein KIN-UC isoform X2 n=1 Tax=Nymphaea colorata TaxID=210225 RepID=UPI00214F5844|nr:kinesin-like protein KIN-UC isoform X2 [Nymphaea colorata]